MYSQRPVDRSHGVAAHRSRGVQFGVMRHHVVVRTRFINDRLTTETTVRSRSRQRECVVWTRTQRARDDGDGRCVHDVKANRTRPMGSEKQKQKNLKRIVYVRC